MKKRKSELDKEYSKIPKWYWIYGLHDAEILSFSEMDLPTDWKSKTPRHNCLEIQFNSAGAMTKIKKLVFYNYSLKSEIDIKTMQKPWWMGDRLTCLPDNRFLLEVEMEDAEGERSVFSITFEDISVK